MKKILIFAFFTLLTSLSTSAFAQILPDNVTGGESMSGEVTLNSAAENVSGEIQIDLPFDPNEVENNEVTVPPIQYNSAYDLSTATNVETGPASIALFLVALVLGSVIYAYRLRMEGNQ